MKILNVILISSAFFFAACATTRQYEANVEGFKGRSVAELLNAWGPPAEIKTLTDRTKAYDYVRRLPPDPAAKNSRSTASQPISCVTSFIVDDTGTITSWTIKGYDCRAR